MKQRGWIHGDDYVPHDAKIKEWGSGRTRVETMQSMGLSPLLVPLAGLEDGINAVRRTLPLCVFHPRCEPGLAALEQYQREWDDDKKAFKLNPLHNWTSHLRRRLPVSRSGLETGPETGYQGSPTGWLYAPTAAYHATTRDQAMTRELVYRMRTCAAALAGNGEPTAVIRAARRRGPPDRGQQRLDPAGSRSASRCRLSPALTRQVATRPVYLPTPGSW